MSDLVVAIGLVLVIEGLLWSLFPGVGRKLLAVTAGASELISDLWSEYARVRAALGEGGSGRDGIDRR